MDLSDLPIVDNHGHPFLIDPWTVSRETFLQIFSEGRPGSMTRHLVQGGYYQRTLHALAKELHTEADLPTVLDARRRLGPASVRDMVVARRIETLLIDTGYPATAMSLQDMRALVPCDIREIVRIETLAQGLLAAGGSYASFVEAYRSALTAAAARAVSLKSVIAYRSGLAVRPWSEAEARASHRDVAARVAAGGSPRLTEKPLLDTLFLIALEIAVETGRPIQVHAGWGDTDVDLPQANPVLLRPVVEDPRWAEARIVVLHQAYPYFREAAFMAAVWPQVFLDLSLAIPYLGPGAVLPLIEILSLAPHSKLLYGSDVQGLPELFALSADWGRAALGEALEWIESRGGLPGGDAQAVARRILSDNARDLYRL